MSKESGSDYTKIIIRDMEVMTRIGIHPHEKKNKQRIIVTVEAHTKPPRNWQQDSIDNVLNYERMVAEIKSATGKGQIHLVETLAEMLAEKFLTEPLIQAVTIRVEKPDIFNDMKSVGVEIFRRKNKASALRKKSTRR